jgi:hypothetical protein
MSEDEDFSLLSDEQMADLEWSRRAVDEAERKRFDDEMLPWRRPNGQAPPRQQKAKTLPPSRVTSAAAFMRTYTPISYTVEGLLPSGFMYALTARTGAGKTAFAQVMTFSVSINRPAIQNSIHKTRRRLPQKCQPACGHLIQDGVELI